jgi:metal-responsive CopG/Arc/MetJ family transcriptional regulator
MEKSNKPDKRIARQIGVRLPVALISKIDTQAKEECRNRSNMIEFILTRYFQALEECPR